MRNVLGFFNLSYIVRLGIPHKVANSDTVLIPRIAIADLIDRVNILYFSVMSFLISPKQFPAQIS